MLPYFYCFDGKNWNWTVWMQISVDCYSNNFFCNYSTEFWCWLRMWQIFATIIWSICNTVAEHLDHQLYFRLFVWRFKCFFLVFTNSDFLRMDQTSKITQRHWIPSLPFNSSKWPNAFITSFIIRQTFERMNKLRNFDCTHKYHIWFNRIYKACSQLNKVFSE